MPDEQAKENRERPDKDHSQRDKPAKSRRLQRREKRMEFVRSAHEPRKVRVSPANEEHRGLLAHPRAGGFRSTGSVEWPWDTFTKRRLKEGSIKIEQREQNKPEGEAPSGDVRTGKERASPADKQSKQNPAERAEQQARVPGD